MLWPRRTTPGQPPHFFEPAVSSPVAEHSTRLEFLLFRSRCYFGLPLSCLLFSLLLYLPSPLLSFFSFIVSGSLSVPPPSASDDDFDFASFDESSLRLCFSSSFFLFLLKEYRRFLYPLQHPISLPLACSVATLRAAVPCLIIIIVPSLLRCHFKKRLIFLVSCLIFLLHCRYV